MIAQRFAQRDDDLLGKGFNARLAALAWLQDGKLVAAKAGQEAGPADQRLQPVGDQLEDNISCRMAEEIIGFLETVEIDRVERAAQLVGPGFASRQFRKQKRLATPVSVSRLTCRSMIAMVVMRSVASCIVPSMKIGLPSASRTYQAFSVIQILSRRAVAIDLRDEILDPALGDHQPFELFGPACVNIPGPVHARHRADVFGFRFIAVEDGKGGIAADRFAIQLVPIDAAHGIFEQTAVFRFGQQLRVLTTVARTVLFNNERNAANFQLFGANPYEFVRQYLQFSERTIFALGQRKPCQLRHDFGDIEGAAGQLWRQVEKSERN